jgi:membrane protease YdiL (CAAX protease family)
MNSQQISQYSKSKIFGLWLLVTIPMFIFRFLIMPYISEESFVNPGIMYWSLMIIGMIWQFILSMIILKQELGKITWNKLRKRLWINHPIDRKSLKPKKLVYILTIPFIVYGFFIESSGLFSFIEESMNRIFPFLALPHYANIENLARPEFEGKIYVLILLIINCIFNYLLGEELFFRGILLPKMNGAFGKFDWILNGILFASYHVHKINEIPLFIIGSIFIGFLNKKYKSFWPAILIHGVEAIPLTIGVVLVFTGNI